MVAADLVIVALAESEAHLVERVRELEADRDAYRAVVRESLTMIHRLSEQNRQLKSRVYDLLDERRAAQSRTAA